MGVLSKDSRKGKIQRRLCTCLVASRGAVGTPVGGLSNAVHWRHELRTLRGRGQDWRCTCQRHHTEGTSAVRAGSRVHLTQNKLWREERTGHKELAEEA